MKKFVLFTVGLLFITTFGAVVNSENNDIKVIEINEKLQNSDLNIIESEKYCSIELEKAKSTLRIPGEPIIPKCTETYILPFGTSNINVDISYSEIDEIEISKQIEPAQLALIDGKENMKNEIKSEEIYSSSSIYPKEEYQIRKSTGIKDKQHVFFLTVEYYPVRYLPLENKIYLSNNVDIIIEYNLPEKITSFSDDYDMVIIAPSEFEEALQPLIDHKNNHTLITVFKSTEDIFSSYDGIDDAEDIKLFIYDAINPDGLNWGIDYVLLVGGMKGQQREWYVPVRYVSTPNEDAFISDLYFADIFNDTGKFDDWDSNDNGVIGEWKGIKKDDFDGTPDVLVGRLSCRTLDQVNTVVDKIITYESTSPEEKTWFNKLIGIGGDTYADGAAGQYEAEIDTQVSADFMEGFEFERLWASLGALTGQSDFEEAINNGAGFIHMAGHANPTILVTHPPDDNANKITIMRVYTIPIFDAFYALLRGDIIGSISKLTLPINPRLNNNDKLPIVLVGGCHNSEFDTTILNFRSEGINHAYGYGDYPPKCFSWWLTSFENGGSIATIGNSGYGMGLDGANYPTGLDGWLYPRFFYNYNQVGEEYVGGAFAGAITDYVNEFDINKDSEDRQMVEQWILHGDPSLLIGGYE